MRIRRPAGLWTLVFVGVCAAPASAQKTTTTEGLSLLGTLVQLTGPAGSRPAGEAIGLATALEVTTAPFGSSSGGFVFKVDPATGLRVRTASTFGPSFAERVLTAGEGKISVAASFSAATYDKLGDFSMERMELSSSTADTAELTRKAYTSLVLSSETLVMSGSVGATDNLDIAIAVPMVKVKLDGISWVENALGETILRAEGAALSSGLGDVAVQAKYRLLRFGEGQPDPGGLAVMARVRLPTGNRENFRGLGVTRGLVSLLASAGQGRLRPHANVGYEVWEKGVDVASDFPQPTIVNARHQLQYVAGLEFEAAPKLTLLVDFLGRHIYGAGRMGYRIAEPEPGSAAEQLGITSVQAAVALPQGIRKLTLVPGLKWNLRGSFLLSLNALIPVRDNGLYDRFTPVIGLDWTF